MENPLDITVPLLSDSVLLGDIFKWRVWIVKEICYEQELRCAYDPNDKLVSPERPDSLALLGERIDYTIRFQNTGNDYALGVVVRDTFSSDLDMRTFQFLDTSHPDLLQIEFDPEDNHNVAFRFDNIYLPDSTTNEQGSHGFIMYSIKPFDDLDENTVINNTAHIYFDFNPAIVTNTTHSELVETFPIETSIDSEIIKLDVAAFPSPSKGLVYLSKFVENITVIDLTGKKLAGFKNVNQINLSAFEEGTYLLHLETNGVKSTEKIVIIK